MQNDSSTSRGAQSRFLGAEMPIQSCFVVMPFSAATVTPQGLSPWSELYADHIKPVVESAGLRCFRANEIARPGSIIQDVVDALAQSFLVVAEMTGQNPNVFYELGVRHALSRRTILLAQSAKDIPFDLKDNRAIIYSFTPRGAKELESALRDAISEVLADPDHCDNPVQSYLLRRGIVETGSADSDTTVALRMELTSLRAEFSELESAFGALKQVLGPSEDRTVAADIAGTWIDDFQGSREAKYVYLIGDCVVMAYGGRWPGHAWGRFDGDIYRFEWRRFDRSLGGHGVLRLLSNRAVLEGGLWFGSHPPSSDAPPLERHALERASLHVQAEGRQWIELSRGIMKGGGADCGPAYQVDS